MPKYLLKADEYFYLFFLKPGASAIICQNPSTGSTTVQHYYNSGYSTPGLLDTANPIIGLSSTSVSVTGGNLVCSFTRLNSNANSNYFNLNTQSPFLIAAYGQISAGG